MLNPAIWLADRPDFRDSLYARTDVFVTFCQMPVSGDLFADNGFGEDVDLSGGVIRVVAVNGEAAAIGDTISLASGALVTVNADGSFDYDPTGAGNLHTFGGGRFFVDSFSYTISNDPGLLGAEANLRLADLDGTTGFVINGMDAGDFAGFAVSGAGDVNGDGYDDVIIGARNADPDGQSNAGEGYVVFGSAGGFGALDLADLDGTNGFRLDGIDAGDLTGRTVGAAGDVNGDGYDDIIIGAHRADPDGKTDGGESYVVFGKAGGFAASLSLADLDGTNGFRLDAADAGDWNGRWVTTAGDMNGDGYDDLIVGAQRADPDGVNVTGAGYVFFGKAGGFDASFDFANVDGTNGFRIDGIGDGDALGRAVAAAGDVNGDGFDDVILGALYADANGVADAGQSYVVFGKAGGFDASIDVADLDGKNGFRINGIDAGDFSGHAVASAGDVNGDGYDDLIVGANEAAADGKPLSGESYVIFGKRAGFEADLDLADLNGRNGFRIDGVAEGDISGLAVSSAGDVNGDGYDDLFVAARLADPDGVEDAGSCYVIFGQRKGFGDSFDLADLDGKNGFRIDGIDPGDWAGAALASAGDFNDDGFDDLIIGANNGDPDGKANAGESYIVFGRAVWKGDTDTAHVIIAGTTDFSALSESVLGW